MYLDGDYIKATRYMVTNPVYIGFVILPLFLGSVALFLWLIVWTHFS